MNSNTSNPSEWSIRYSRPTRGFSVQRDLSYAEQADDERRFDLYSPVCIRPNSGAIILVSGYPTAGLKRHFGRSAREFESVRSWCELFSAAGIAAIAYDAVDPYTDLQRLIEFWRANAATFGIDPAPLGVFACSGNVPTAVATLTSELTCAILCYGFMLDTANLSTVARAAHRFGFANPEIQGVLDRIPRTTRMLVIRAGLDTFEGLNDGIDAFVNATLMRNLPVTLINHANAPHAFDLLDDGAETKRVIESIVRFATDRLTLAVDCWPSETTVDASADES